MEIYIFIGFMIFIGILISGMFVLIGVMIGERNIKNSYKKLSCRNNSNNDIYHSNSNMYNCNMGSCYKQEFHRQNIGVVRIKQIDPYKESRIKVLANQLEIKLLGEKDE